MAGDKGVAGALHRLGEAGDPPKGAQGLHGGVAAGEDLVGITLVPHVKDQPVPPRVEHTVDGYNQLHRPQAGGPVPPSPGHGVDKPHPQTAAQLRSLAVAETAQLFGHMIEIEIQSCSPPGPAAGPGTRIRTRARRPAGPRRCPAGRPSAPETACGPGTPSAPCRRARASSPSSAP